MIDFGAKEGYEVLKGIIDSDEGSKHLGEVALIPYHSPINELKTLFYNTLYDENASCHMALGIGFSECIKGGIDMDKKEKLSLNQCCKLCRLNHKTTCELLADFIRFGLVELVFHGHKFYFKLNKE